LQRITSSTFHDLMLQPLLKLRPTDNLDAAGYTRITQQAILERLIHVPDRALEACLTYDEFTAQQKPRLQPHI